LNETSASTRRAHKNEHEATLNGLQFIDAFRWGDTCSTVFARQFKTTIWHLIAIAGGVIVCLYFKF
jgi:hypothetical protein